MQLVRWETQELDFGVRGGRLRRARPALANAEVTLACQYRIREGSDAGSRTMLYTIPSTAGEKQIVHVPFVANKGVLFNFLFTVVDDEDPLTDLGFWLYREESWLDVQPWGSTDGILRRPFGNDDLDLVRSMQSAALSAARGGGRPRRCSRRSRGCPARTVRGSRWRRPRPAAGEAAVAQPADAADGSMVCAASSASPVGVRHDRHRRRQPHPLAQRDRGVTSYRDAIMADWYNATTVRC